MEKDGEVKGDGYSYTTENRILDVRLGKWLSIDPYTFPAESPYNAMGNNPIWYNDIYGNKYDRKGEKHVQKAEKAINSRISDLTTEIASDKAEISRLEGVIKNSSDPSEITSAQLSQMDLDFGLGEKQATLQNLQDGIKEIGLMRTSDQLFKIRSNFKKGQGGDTGYGRFSKAVKISFDGELHSLIHELKHGYQFIAGEASFAKDGTNGSLDDLYDEQGAYIRELSFDPHSFDDPELLFNKTITADDITRTKIQNLVDPYKGDKPYADLKDINKNIFNTKPPKGDIFVPASKVVKIK